MALLERRGIGIWKADAQLKFVMDSQHIQVLSDLHASIYHQRESEKLLNCLSSEEAYVYKVNKCEWTFQYLFHDILPEYLDTLSIKSSIWRWFREWGWKHVHQNIGLMVVDFLFAEGAFFQVLYLH